jgi:RNA polymerase sigma-70 factor (ECF subfamily)
MDNSTLRDEQLVKRYIKGDESCLATLIERHQQRIFGYIMMLVRNRTVAEDIFQETFFKVVFTLKSGNYHEEGKFLPWVLRIAHNLGIDGFRVKEKMPTVSHVRRFKDEEDVDIFSLLKLEDNCHEELVTRLEEREELKRMIMRLPPEQREVLIMRHYLDMSFKEISDAAKVNLNTALGRMRYALINLRKMAGESEVFSDV